MLSDTHAEHIVDAKQIKCSVPILVDVEHIEYCLVVCNGTNNYINHFSAGIWKFLENEGIRMNAFQFSMWLACNQLEKWRRFKL